MINNRKPKIAILGLMTDGYENVFPGITARQDKYAHQLVETLSPVADILYTKPAMNKTQIEQRVKEYNHAEVDGILIVLFAYSQGAWLTHALQENRLPLALAVVQPDQTIKEDFVELDLTVNQGIHGAQDNCNIMTRLGLKFQVFAGNRLDESFLKFVDDFGHATQTAKKLRNMRTAIFARMQGMGDILTDEFGLLSQIGIESCHETLGSIYSLMQEVTQEEIQEQIDYDNEIATVDTNLSHESHAEAVRMYIGFHRFLQNNNYDAFTAHFDIFAEDRRFKQLPLYAASHLLAKGYGYAAEGDTMCASMVAASNTLCGNANFTEMYAMDFEKQAILFCHAGEGNWATHRKDVKPKLIDRYLGEGGLENPPTFVFTPEPGEATLTSLVSLGGNRFRLVVSIGEILPINNLAKCEMPYFFWRPSSGIQACVESWLKAGGTHHEVISIGDVRKRYKMLCDIINIEYYEC